MAALGIGVGFSQAQQAGVAQPRFANEETFTNGFNFCRVFFSSIRREKRGWRTDYPGAEINFSIRLSELTKTRVSFGRDGGDARDPDHVVVRLTDDALFQCPFVMMEDSGSARLSNRETTRLREYLQKGGFLLVADYWGSAARRQWDATMGRILPTEQYPIVDIPTDHAIWRTFLEVTEVPQMASIQFWRRSRGGISERGADSRDVSARGIADAHGRLMVVMLHNTDIPDGWEREGEDREYFYRFSPNAYAVGIDILLYAMTH